MSINLYNQINFEASRLIACLSATLSICQRISAKPSANFILPEGLKQIQCQVHIIALAKISILFSYYAKFAIELVKNIN